MARATVTRARSITVLVLASILLVPPASAAAKQPDRFTDLRINVSCGELRSTAGTLFFDLHVSVEGSFANLALFPPGADPEFDPPLLYAPGEVQYTLSGMSLTATIPMVRPTAQGEEPAGDAAVSATFTPAGDPITIDERHRFGNAWERLQGTVQPVTASGTVTLPTGETVSFTGCPGDVGTINVFRTRPNAFVVSGTFSTFSCRLETAEGLAFLFGQLSEGHGFVEVIFLPSDASLPPLGGGTGVEFATLQRVTASIPVRNLETRAEAGAAELSASLVATGQTKTYRQRSATGHAKVIEEVLAMTGTLRLPTGQVFEDLSGCEATLVDIHSRFSNPMGPKPGGAVPVNDTPAGAVTLTRGSVLRNVWTGGAVVAPEQPCVQVLDGFEEPVTFGRTVWYRITGTGQPVTVDTARSDFDTVIGVYVARNGRLEQVACVDDVVLGRTSEGRTLQARVTFPTVAGATYYVQIGGWTFPRPFNPEFGRLRVSVR